VDDAYSGVYRFDNVYLRRGAFFVLGDKFIVDGEMLIDENSVLTHYDATLSFESHLELEVGSLEVAADSSIDAAGRGYLGGLREGNGCNVQTILGLVGSAQYTGGSYGGLGGTTGNAPNPVYGIESNPAELGSGGGCGTYSRTGGDGGGWIRIIAGDILLNGSIAAIGGVGQNYNAGGGSGGAINIDTQALSGAGEIRADGAAAPTEIGGGGGRVRVSSEGGSFSGAITANGGVGSDRSGQAGSVVIE